MRLLWNVFKLRHETDSDNSGIENCLFFMFKSHKYSQRPSPHRPIKTDLDLRGFNINYNYKLNVIHICLFALFAQIAENQHKTVHFENNYMNMVKIWLVVE